MSGGRDAEDSLRHLRAARADQPREADDLAPPQREGDVLECAAAAKAPHLQQRLAGRVRRPVEQLAERAADHHLDQPRHVEITGAAGVDPLAVPHHRDSVGDLEHLVQPVRDIHDGDPALGQFSHDAKQTLGLPLC